MKVAKKAPIAWNKGFAFVARKTGCGLEAVTTPVYAHDDRGEGLRRFRCSLGLSFREAANILDVSIVEMSGLERNSHGFIEDKDWERAYDLLRQHAATKGAR